MKKDGSKNLATQRERNRVEGKATHKSNSNMALLLFSHPSDERKSKPCYDAVRAKMSLKEGVMKFKRNLLVKNVT